MAAIKVRVMEQCFFESELKQPGSVFWLTDIKDASGKVTVPAEKQFSARFMEKAGAAVKGKAEITADQAQARADNNAALDREAKENTKGAAHIVADVPSNESPI